MNSARNLPKLSCSCFRPLIVSAAFCLFFGFGSLSAKVQVFQNFDTAELEIRSLPVEAANNWGEHYAFTLSVLGLSRGGEFLPLLAIALENVSGDENRWLAVWNLSEEDPGFGQRVRALLPGPWGPRSGGRTEETIDLSGFPKPYQAARNRKGRAWSRVQWNATKKIAEVVNLINPARFLLHSYVHHRNDRDDRLFHQVYTLLRVYEEVSAVDPSPLHLSPGAMVDLKYQLLVNQRALGIVMQEESIFEFVKQYESKLRVQMGKAASYLHAEANAHYLGFQEVSYGLQGRPPVVHAALIYIRKADLPERLPRWSSRNVFDLTYNPYTHAEIRRLMEAYPEEPIPLAFYALSSDLTLRPIIVADFFRKGNVRLRQSTSTVRIGLEHVFSITRLPLLYETMRRVAAFSLDKKDYTHFNPRSTATGVESLRLFARMDWNLDPDTNYMLLSALEHRVANPLAESFRRESANARINFAQLMGEDRGRLALYLRSLFEDEIREDLNLGERAVFAEDFKRFRAESEFQDALRLVRRFNEHRHLSGYSWERVWEAWEVLNRHDPERSREESEIFLSRLERLYPTAIPESFRARVASFLYPERLKAEVYSESGGLLP